MAAVAKHASFIGGLAAQEQGASIKKPGMHPALQKE
jgi:hypothetical protein